MYLGWTGMKYGTVEGPCGLTLFSYPGMSSRNSDLTWLTESDINGKLESLQLQNGIPLDEMYKIYGDSIFPWLSCLLSRYHGPNLTAVQDLENEVMSGEREHVEWHYGEVKQLFPFIDYALKNKILSSPVREAFVTAMILRNCHCCMNENKTSKFFECVPPFLEVYMA
jgi:hypothetical protein